jgi:hypothetical protein
MGAYAYCQDPGGPVYPLVNLPIDYTANLATDLWSNPQQPSREYTNFQGVVMEHKQTYPPIGHRFLSIPGYDPYSVNPLRNYPNLTLSTGQKFSNLKKGPNDITLINCANTMGGWDGKNPYRPAVNGKTYMCTPWYLNDPTKDTTYAFDVPSYADNQVNAIWRFTSCQTCTPSCTNKCGQPDGCGGICQNTDNTTPAAPTNLSPVSGTTISNTSGSTFAVSWAAVTGASYYEVQVYPTGTLAGQECSASGSSCASNLSTLSYSFTLSPGVLNYTWRVRAVNSKCGLTPGPWSTATFSLDGSISGTIYLDSSETATINAGTGLCQVSGSPSTQNPGNNSAVTAQWGSPVTTTTGTITGATYTISGVNPYPNTAVTLTPNLTQFSCVCPAGCSYSGLSSPKTGLNFYLTNMRPGWWQTSNGLVYAGSRLGSSVVSIIPATTCTAPTCTPSLSTRDSNKTVGSAGFTFTGGGSVDFTPAGQDTETAANYINEDGNNYSILGTDFTGTRSTSSREDYTYFANLVSLGSTPTDDFNGSKPTAAPSNGKAYYHNGDITISTPWSLSKTDKMIFFVNGNLRITQPISVAPGGFLAFIVKKNIIFDKGLGQSSPTSTTASVAGLFVADGQIVVEANASSVNDLKFVGEGTFVGWQGFDLRRKYVPQAANATAPNEYFRYRPDFMLNAPASILSPLAIWQETN